MRAVTRTAGVDGTAAGHVIVQDDFIIPRGRYDGINPAVMLTLMEFTYTFSMMFDALSVILYGITQNYLEMKENPPIS